MTKIYNSYLDHNVTKASKFCETSLFNEHRNLHFNQKISHSWSSRKLMGLPETYFRSSHDNDFNVAIQYLLTLDPIQWAQLVEDPSQPLHLRLASGSLLGLYGDPRISPFAPIMVTISTKGLVTLGLAVEEAAKIYKDLKSLGVELNWIEKECPLYKVELSSFRITKYPITNFEFSLFLEDTGYTDIPTSWTFGRYPLEKANHPVFTIKPKSADAYANWLAKKTGRPFRLPTEAEWEFAAAGPDRLEFPWGNEFIRGISNTAELGLLDSSPIGCFPAGNSYFGISDMAGNVEEYVFDTYSPYPNGKLIIDDLYRICPDYRIARGGSFTRFRDLARNKRRHGWNPNSEVYVMGFRLVEDI